MDKNKNSLNIESLKKAFALLEKFTHHDTTDQEKAGIIKAFEFCYELSWKLMKKVLFIEGISANSPRDIFREAASVGLITDPRPWFKFLEERNKTVHTYDLETVEAILLKIIPEFKEELGNFIIILQDVLKNRPQ